MTLIMTSPGTMNCMYGTPPISPTRDPITLPKMMKYSVVVITGGTMVCGQILSNRVTSLITIV